MQTCIRGDAIVSLILPAHDRKRLARYAMQTRRCRPPSRQVGRDIPSRHGGLTIRRRAAGDCFAYADVRENDAPGRRASTQYRHRLGLSVEPKVDIANAGRREWEEAGMSEGPDVDGR